MTAMNPFNVQDHFRVRSDTNSADGGTPTWVTTEDQANSPTSSLTWNTATTFRIRYTVSNTGDANATADYQLFVSKNGGAYAAVTTTSSNVQAVDASTDADATVLQSANYVLSAGSGSAVNGEYSEDGIVSTNLNLGSYQELEFGITIVDADVSHNDTLDFRVYYNGAAMDSYTITPRITVNKSTTHTGTGAINTTVPTLSGSGNAGIAYQTHITASENMATDSAITTASFTPSNNSLLVVMMAALDANGYGGTVSISDTQSLTWTKRVEEVNTNGWSSVAVIWTAPVTTGASMTITVDSDAVLGSGEDQNGWIGVTVAEATDASGNTPEFIQQMGDGGAGGRTGSYTGNFKFATLGNGVLFSVKAEDSSSGVADSTDTGTGWTQLYESVGTYSVYHSQVRNDNYTGLDVVLDQWEAGFSYSIAAIEVGPTPPTKVLPTHRSGGAFTSSPGTSASITVPNNNAVYVTIAAAQDAAGQPTVSVSGLTLSWSQAGSVAWRSQRTLALWKAVNTSGSDQTGSLSLTVTGNGGSFTEAKYSIDTFNNIDLTTPNGTVDTNTTESASSLAVTLTDTPDTDDLVFAGFGIENTAQSPTLESSLTQLFYHASGSTVRELIVGYDNTTALDTTPSVSVTGTDGIGGIATVLNVSSTAKTGTGAINTTVPTLSGSGVMGRSGSGAISTPVPSLSASGTITKTGSGAITTTVPTLSGSGTTGKVGSGAINTTVPLLSASGTITKTGTGAITTPLPTTTGSGVMGRSGSGAINTPVPALSGTGTVSGGTLVTGTGAISSTVPLLSATGEITKTGTGAITTPVTLLSGNGTRILTGTGAISSPVPLLSGSGEVKKTGTGAIVAPLPLLSGSGFITKTGTGSITTPLAILSGAGVMGRLGSGAITTPKPLLSGSGSINGESLPSGGIAARRRRRFS